MFIAVCYGTRPEYLKLLPFIKLLISKSVSHKVYHILQHIELNETPDFKEISVPVRTDISNRLNAIGASILDNLDSVFDKSHTHCVVQGDTSTALFCALYSFHNKIQVVHIEAGLRTYNIDAPWPEEANRQMISRIASFHFTPHDDCTELLNKECVGGAKFTVGNTILDLIKSYNLAVTQDNIVLITFHRRENWDKIDIFIEQVKDILKTDSDIHLFWCMHPNPELQNRIKRSFESYENLTLSPPLNHKDFTMIMAKCKYLITDSGGLQEEASFLGKQCLILREMTERYHIPYPYIHLIKDIGKLAEYLRTLTISTLEPCNVYGDGTASEKILRSLLKLHINLL
jgi:UDP-N-acetylglucosamine 2-epimerase (non-hydrolysing)